MRNDKPKTTEYSESWDTGTYQTGYARPRDEHRGIIAILMILVTFLGGIASALGLINIRLIQQLSQERQAPSNVSVYMEGSQTVPSANDQNAQAPSLPSTSVDFQLEAPSENVLPKDPCSEEILLQNAPSIVSIFIGGNRDDDPDTCGVILDEAGFLITNAYPISDGEPVFVRLSDGRLFRATVVGKDEFTDLAVLYIDATDLTAAHFTTADCLDTGDFVTAASVGNLVSAGTVDHITDYSIGSQTISLLQTDLVSVSGPIYNSCGQIVGFASRSLETKNGTMVIPSAIVKEVVEQIIQQGSIAGRPSLGVEMEEIQPLHQHYWQLPSGLRITRIDAGDAQLAGLLPGDILISLNGQPISNRESLCAVLRTLREGDRVMATVVREEQEMTLELTIQLSGEIE